MHIINVQFIKHVLGWKNTWIVIHISAHIGHETCVRIQ